MKIFFFFGEKRVNPEQYGLIYLQNRDWTANPFHRKEKVKEGD